MKEGEIGGVLASSFWSFRSLVQTYGARFSCDIFPRYRQAAVHGKRGSQSEPSRPRSGVQEPFIDSEILAGRADLQMQINEW